MTLHDGDSEAESTMVLAQQQQAFRRTQQRLKKQKEKERRLLEDQDNLLLSKTKAVASLESVKKSLAEQNKKIKEMNDGYDAKIDSIRGEIRSKKRDFMKLKQSLKEKTNRLQKDLSFLMKLTDVFFAPTEQSKIWEQSEYHTSTQMWDLPAIRSKKEWEFVRLPDDASSAAKMGVRIGTEKQSSALFEMQKGGRVRINSKAQKRKIGHDGIKDTKHNENSAFDILSQKNSKYKKIMSKHAREIKEIIALLDSITPKSVEGKVEQSRQLNRRTPMEVLQKCAKLCKDVAGK